MPSAVISPGVMRTAVIVDAVRTPIGRRNGKLKDLHPVDLAAHVLGALAQRNAVDPAQIDDVIMGCVMQVGEQALNIGRNAVLAAHWPESVPATTVDRQCGSSLQAVHFAAQGVMAGAYDLVVAAGVESMTRIPMGASFSARELGRPTTSSISARYAPVGGLQPQGIAAEAIAERWGFTREDLDAYSARSHQRAAQATREGRFDAEIIAVPVGARRGAAILRVDEGIRGDASTETLAALKPAFAPDGRVTAGNSSQISDGAAALLIASEEKAAELGLRPRARLRAFALAGVDPVTMLTGPIPATRKVLDRCGLTLDDIDRVEISEAFASVVLAWQRELHADPSKVNVNGGAIALGHPLGASGARLLTTLVHELERCGGYFGLVVMCEGGGLANATVIERIV